VVKPDLQEALGAALIVAGFATWLGLSAALFAAGVALVVKAVSTEIGAP
jgi:hypothetical protein